MIVLYSIDLGVVEKMDDKDIDEIIYHIKKLKNVDIKKEPSTEDSARADNETNTGKSVMKAQSRRDRNQDTETTITKQDEAMEKIKNLEENDPVTIMNPEAIGWTDDSTVLCDVCDQEMKLGKNLSGLVIADEFFACEHCCQELSKDELMEWTKSKMVSANDVRPIGLWVIQQQRDDKTVQK
jgi:hypothetical protein